MNKETQFVKITVKSNVQETIAGLMNIITLANKYLLHLKTLIKVINIPAARL